MALIARNLRYRSGISGFLRLVAVIVFAAIMVLFPYQIFPAAKQGIDAWWNVVFPALFPFFVISELLMEFGIVHFLSVLLEPVMRPLFNISGSGAFVMAVGYTSGAPIGGVLTSRLRKQRFLNKDEAERLVAFTNNASPLFMLSAISIGFLGQPAVGWILAGSHYLANLILGFSLSLLSKPKSGLTPAIKTGSLFSQAIRTMQTSQRGLNRPLGKVFGDAIKNSMQTILIIGGFIVLFSVIIQTLSIMGFIGLAAKVIGFILAPLGFDPSLFTPLASGIIEMTIGSKMVAESNAPLMQQLICISIILGWAGISIHAQVATMIVETDIRLEKYILTRFLQGILAGILTFFYYDLTLPATLVKLPTSPPPTSLIVVSSLKAMLIILVFLIALSFLIYVSRQLKLLLNK